ncbi:MAG: hypothetical protein V4671_06640 [Armatimonadota bacterium]
MTTSRTKILCALSPLLLLPLAGSGCSRPQPVTMAPPVNNAPVNSAPINTAPPVTGGAQQGAAPTGENVFDWHDVPTGEQIPVTRGVFDQSGYQLFAGSGETIVVPFANQNMYVMRFGKSTSGGMYFTSDGKIPTLYVPNGGYLENAVAQGAKWYPFPQNYAYTQPVYMGIAPSWSAYTGMGWYPGMAYYGGYWSPHPYGYGGGISPFVAMVGLSMLINNRPYYGWNSYQNYYRSNPGSSVRMRTVYNNYNNTRRNSPSAFGRSRYGATGSNGRGFGSSSGSSGSFSSGRRFGGGTGSTGSFGSSNRRFGSGSTGSTGSFGNSARTGSGSSTFGGSSRPSGSFGSGSSSGYSSPTRRSPGSFGSGSSSGYGGSFGSSHRGFGSGSSGSSSSTPSFGSSRRSSGGSFGGGSSFGGSRRSSGGFGRRR